MIRTMGPGIYAAELRFEIAQLKAVCARVCEDEPTEKAMAARRALAMKRLAQIRGELLRMLSRTEVA